MQLTPKLKHKKTPKSNWNRKYFINSVIKQKQSMQLAVQLTHFMFNHNVCPTLYANNRQWNVTKQIDWLCFLIGRTKRQDSFLFFLFQCKWRKRWSGKNKRDVSFEWSKNHTTKSTIHLLDFGWFLAQDMAQPLLVPTPFFCNDSCFMYLFFRKNSITVFF